jgi:hypothetical protein
MTRTEQKILEPRTRAKLVILGLLLVIALTAVGFLADDPVRLRGTIDPAAATP